MKQIYRGIWAENLKEGQELPVGGSIWSETLDTKLLLDFGVFSSRINDFFNKDSVMGFYQERQKAVENYLTKVAPTLDPYLFFVANHVQSGVQKMLLVDSDLDDDTIKKNTALRMEKFRSSIAKISDLKGLAMCAEQTALGQYLLQNSLSENYSSASMSGVWTENPKLEVNDHSFIVIKNDSNNTFVFDISRPKSVSGLPRILTTDIPMTYELFKDKQNLLVGSTELFGGKRHYFGIGNPYLMDQERIVYEKSND